MNDKEIKSILKEHSSWLKKEGGNRADLTGADLTGANLSRANLTGANLTRADLYRANLTGADLTGANLSRADLYRANLTDANLTDANLTDANLSRANLTGANLTRALGIINIQSPYPYMAIGYSNNNVLRVRLGCHDRTVEDWDADFWNNPLAFPEGSPQGIIRLKVYESIKNLLKLIYGGNNER